MEQSALNDEFQNPKKRIEKMKHKGFALKCLKPENKRIARDSRIFSNNLKIFVELAIYLIQK